MREIRLGDTTNFKFTTVSGSGVPITLAGSPILAAYPDNSTTEVLSGITLSVDFDSRTGLHNARVIASSANGYAPNTEYTIIVASGTVGGASIVGYTVGEFVIERFNGALSILKDVFTGSGAGLRIATLKQLAISNSSGTAVLAISTGNNGAGILAQGNGTGAGLQCQGGDGVGGHGLSAFGGNDGSGLACVAGAAASQRYGIDAVGPSGADNQGAGIGAFGEGNGAGIVAVGGAGTTGDRSHGIWAIAGGSGLGMRIEGTTSGHAALGLYGVGDGSPGLDILGGFVSLGSPAIRAEGVTAMQCVAYQDNGIEVISGFDGSQLSIGADLNASAIVRGTNTASATITTVPTSSLSPSAAGPDQFKNRILIFDKTTPTVALRGQAAQITASTSGGILSVSSLTTAPMSGDVFRIY